MKRHSAAILTGLFVVGSNLSAQDAPKYYEAEYLTALKRVVVLVDSLDAHFDAWIVREKRKQAIRRVDRFAKSLYRLCASKDELAISVASPFATQSELAEDARRVRDDLSVVRERFESLGEMIARESISRGFADSERIIREGLGGKAVLVEQLVYESRQSAFDRRRFESQANQAGALCRQAQQTSTSFAAKLTAM